jgi:uncharacterized protein DUF6632
MNDSTREMLLKAALVVFGVILLLVYPLSLVWPSGWMMLDQIVNQMRLRCSEGLRAALIRNTPSTAYIPHII